MNILLINHYAGSPRHGMEFRPYYMAQRWREMGHNVTILAASESHVRRMAPAVDGMAAEEWIDGVRYVWLRTPRYAGNGAMRAVNMAAFVAVGLSSQRRVAGEHRPDAVVASSTYPLDIVLARRLARRYGAALIFEVHDLWPLSPIELGGMSPRHPFIRVMQWAENLAYGTADRVVSILPETLEHMTAHGMAPEKFAYIPNGIDAGEWAATPLPLPEQHAEALAKLKGEHQFVVGYAGAHGVANALETIIEGAGMLKDENIAFVLVGHGPEKLALERHAAAIGATNVTFLPPVPKGAIPSLLAQFDAACLTLRRQPLFRYGVSPNKLMDYMIAGRPVLNAVEAGNDLVAESGCGVSVAAENPVALADGARRLARMTASERAEMGVRGRSFILEHHEYGVLARRFIEVIECARSGRVAP